MTLRLVYTFFGYYLTLALFGAVGLLLSGLSWLAGALPATEQLERFFQRTIHRLCATFVRWTAFTRLLHVHYHGFGELRRMPKGSVLVANHPGLTDITSLLARLPKAVCIFKPAIRRNPVLGAAARRAGYLASDGGHEVIRQVTAKLAAGDTVIIFPEGTRTPPGVPVLPFKPGFVLMARRAGVPIQLVRVTCSRPVLAKGRAWWKLPPLPARVDLTVGPRLHVAPLAETAAAAAEIEAWFRNPPEAAACPRWSPALTCATP
ncbi:MAG: lysophospholipid acyltransferase family protein [Verrucomicrobia bacterium]|nr:lysophospholipid acyltransferase family protein [Verrucomicrobiota bacterium]